MQLTKDDSTSVYLDFINQNDWSKNHFQVANQVTMEGIHKEPIRCNYFGKWASISPGRTQAQRLRNERSL